MIKIAELLVALATKKAECESHTSMVMELREALKAIPILDTDKETEAIRDKALSSTTCLEDKFRARLLKAETKITPMLERWRGMAASGTQMKARSELWGMFRALEHEIGIKATALTKEADGLEGK